jgi:hypothetical protein
MTTGQAPIRIKTGNALDVEDTTSNVAINQAMMEALSAANIDGKDVYPNYVGAQHLSAADAIIHGAFKAGSMMIGAGGVNISSAEDGETPTTGLYMGGSLFSLYKSGVSQVTLDGQTGNASFKGTVYADAGSFPGSLVTGNISVASGGVTISNDGGASGIYIGANQIYCKAGGVTKFLLNGATGEITAYKFTLVADSASQLNLGSGTHVFADSIQVGSTPGITFGTMKGDISDAADAAADAASDAATALSEAKGRIKPGGGVTVDGDKHITTIDMSGGIVIKTSTSTARVQMTSKGIAIYNSSGTVVVQADHSNGLWVNNDTSGSPGVTERVSLAYDGYEVGSIAGGNSTTVQFQQRGNGDTLSINFDLVELCPSISGVVRVGGDSKLYAKHRTYDGSYKGDTTFSFYAASSSGGSPTVKHTVTFKDGLITSWAAS